MYELKLEQFSGPYDLLLELIKSNDLEITKISLSQVTEQFLNYLDLLDLSDEHSEELVSFLVVASQLLYLKSKVLLPDIVEEDDADMLEKHLKMYQTFVVAAERIQSIFSDSERLYSNTKVEFPVEKTFSPSLNCTTESLHSFYVSVLARLTPVVKLPRLFFDKVISLSERVNQLRAFLSNRQTFYFSHIARQSENKIDLIVSFLAILELAHQKHFTLHQESHGDEIIITRL